MPAELDDVIALPAWAPLAIASLAVVIALMVTGAVPNVQAALIGCLLLGLFRCIDINTVYRAIQWPTLFLIVGMLPFSIALQNTGGVDLAVQALLGAMGDANPIDHVDCGVCRYRHSRPLYIEHGNRCTDGTRCCCACR